jgi:UDP-hydrolysing UDP-N-acetyl-D-glucosamine 2-epimerase
MRKICFVINNRANYARIKSAIRECTLRNDIKVQIVVGASGLIDRFGDVVEIIKKDGFEVNEKLHTVVEGNEPISMVKTTAMSLLSLSEVFYRTNPDIVVTVADRFETIATAIAASYMNIPLAHTQGGEITGSIDDNVRHSITKLAHIHFPATEKAKEVLIGKLGENPECVFHVGCPSIDIAHETKGETTKSIMTRYSGVGADLDFEKPYILVSQHSDTLEYIKAKEQISATLESINSLQYQCIWLWPNMDSGSDFISKKLREFRENNQNSKIRFYKNFEPQDYINILRNSTCIVGNSSSGIREASYLGTPSVNVGERQRGRVKLSNVIDVAYNSKEITEAIKVQILKKSYAQDLTYGDGTSGRQIAEILATCKLSVKKNPISN